MWSRQWPASQIDLTARCFGPVEEETPSRPLGTIATVARRENGIAQRGLSVMLMTRGPRGMGLRCPIGLHVGGDYQLQIGTAGGEVLGIRITSSRSRPDGSYDIGAVELRAEIFSSVAA